MSDVVDPQSDKTTGYHLFLEPTGRIAEELGALIKRLAADADSPSFTPHVTVLARIPVQDEGDLLKKAELFASQLSSMTVTLGELQTEQTYYRALYSRLVEQDTMWNLHRVAAEVFSMEENPDYIAHLSLLYGNFSEEKLQEIASTISMPTEKTFIADRLHVYRTEGQVGEWYKVGEVLFASQR